MRYVLMLLALVAVFANAGFYELAGGLDTLNVLDTLDGDATITTRATHIRTSLFSGVFVINVKVIELEGDMACTLFYATGFDTLHFYNWKNLKVFAGSDSAAFRIRPDCYPYWQFKWKGAATSTDNGQVWPIIVNSVTKY